MINEICITGINITIDLLFSFQVHVGCVHVASDMPPSAVGCYDNSAVSGVTKTILFPNSVKAHRFLP